MLPKNLAYPTDGRVRTVTTFIACRPRILWSFPLRMQFAVEGLLERWSMYRHILIATDGSELAEHAVTNGLSLAKSVGAKVTVIIVHEAPVDATLSFLEQVEKHGMRVLDRESRRRTHAAGPGNTM